MKKILFLGTRIPYPPIGGDRAKNYNLIQQLSKQYQLTMIFLSKQEPLSKEAHDILSQYGEVIVFEKSFWAFYLNLALAFFKIPTPLQISTYHFADMQTKIDELVKTHDLVFANLIRTASYVLDKPVPKICDMADSIAQNYKRSFKTVRSLGHKIFYYFESKWLVPYEQMVIDRCNLVTLFNQQEIESLGSPSHMRWIPHGVNEKLLSYAPLAGKERAVAFFGKMDYRPNIDAALWFIDHVMPGLASDIKFYIVGAYPTSELLRRVNERIVITGFLDDPYQFLSGMSAVIAPMQTGGGIQNKVLEAMAIGQVNIVSPVAAAPMLGAEPGRDLLVADTAEQWQEVITEVVNEPAQFADVGKNAKAYIEKQFTWQISGQAYAAYIEEVLS